MSKRARELGVASGHDKRDLALDLRASELPGKVGKIAAPNPLVYLRKLNADRRLSVTEGIERQFREGLESLRGRPNVRDVRVLGAVGVVEVKRLPAQSDISRVIREHGVWLRPFCNFVYSMPPLVSDGRTVERIVAAIADLVSAPPGPPPQDGDFHE